MDFENFMDSIYRQPEKKKTEKKKVIIRKKEKEPEPPKEEIGIELGGVDLEQMGEFLKANLLITMLKSMGLEDDEGLEFVRILLRNGCPAEALIKSLVEMAGALGEEDDNE